MQGLPAALSILHCSTRPKYPALHNPPPPPPLPPTYLQVVSVSLSVTSPLPKAVFSRAGPPNSWFRESNKVYWRPDLLSRDKTHSEGLTPQDGDVSVETITRPLNLHKRWGFVFHTQKDWRSGVFEEMELGVHTRPPFESFPDCEVACVYELSLIQILNFRFQLIWLE